MGSPPSNITLFTFPENIGPTMNPTASPTVNPTLSPTMNPTMDPTLGPIFFSTNVSSFPDGYNSTTVGDFKSYLEEGSVASIIISVVIACGAIVYVSYQYYLSIGKDLEDEVTSPEDSLL